MVTSGLDLITFRSSTLVRFDLPAPVNPKMPEWYLIRLSKLMVSGSSKPSMVPTTSPLGTHRNSSTVFLERRWTLAPASGRILDFSNVTFSPSTVMEYQVGMAPMSIHVSCDLPQLSFIVSRYSLLRTVGIETSIPSIWKWIGFTPTTSKIR